METSLRVLQRDKQLAKLIKRHGKPTLSRYFPDAPGIFEALLRSIIYQQLSGKAAASIHARFIKLFPRKHPTPKTLLKIAAEDLRGCGLSYQKIEYMRDLARKFEDKTVAHKKFASMTSEEIVEHLTQVKGIGEWTVHMLLIFTLGRLDILPTGDLGIRKGFQAAYGLKALPDKRTMEKLALPWREHASVASWYLWRIADEAKKPSPRAKR